jgi:GST-like protein
MAQRKKSSRTAVSKRSASKKPARKTAGRNAPLRNQRARKPASGGKSNIPIALYFWPTPNGQKITIFLEEAHLPYEIRPVNIAKGEQFDPAFLKISPNNRMPAIVDPAGPGGKPISIFESGAILRYLGEKTGRFYPADAKGKTKVDEWLFWQVGGLGPMAGQAGHFRNYAPEKIPYAIDRYTNEVHRLFGVMERQLKGGKKFIAGRYSIGDMAIFPWLSSANAQFGLIDEFPHLKAWMERMGTRPGVKRGMAAGQALRQRGIDLSKDEEARKILFNQRARVAE